MFESLKSFEPQYDEMFKEPFPLQRIDPNPVVYDNFPYKPEETVEELYLDYINMLEILRKKYLETKDEKLARLLIDLLPAGIYSKYN